MKYFINRFTQLLEEGKVSDLADYLAVKNSSIIYQWKNGEKTPRLNYLIKIANFFECSLDYLLGRSNDAYEINYTPNIKFVDQLEKVMKEKHVKQNQLVNNKIVTRTAFYNWRNKNSSPPMEIVVALADYLNVSVDHLVGRE